MAQSGTALPSPDSSGVAPQGELWFVGEALGYCCLTAPDTQGHTASHGRAGPRNWPFQMLPIQAVYPGPRGAQNTEVRADLALALDYGVGGMAEALGS